MTKPKSSGPAARSAAYDGRIALPGPDSSDGLPLARCLNERRSLREFSRGPLSLAEAGQLLWAAQGWTHREGLRTAPSAGALYPLEIVLAAGEIEGLEAGVYRYEPRAHALVGLGAGDRRPALGAAAYGQTWIAAAPMIVAVAAVFQRTAAKYGTRGARYVLIEAGHAAENVCLQAVSLGLGATVVGAFDDGAVAAQLSLSPPLAPLLLIPVGRP